MKNVCLGNGEYVLELEDMSSGAAENVNCVM